MLAAMDARIALVSGGARGIGHGVARGLADVGYRVFITDRDRAVAERAAEELSEGATGSVQGLELEVKDQGSVDRVISEIAAGPGELDALVNNAGVMDNFNERAGDIDLDSAAEIVEVNLFGVWRLTQAAMPLLRDSGHGSIVNISSGLGQLHDMGSGRASYRVSKTALNALTRVLANEERENDILVNTMCPGWVRTDLGGPNARRSIEEGADTAIWLATLPGDGPTGRFFRDRQPIPW